MNARNPRMGRKRCFWGGKEDPGTLSLRESVPEPAVRVVSVDSVNHGRVRNVAFGLGRRILGHFPPEKVSQNSRIGWFQWMLEIHGRSGNIAFGFRR